jgi:hypothetical protein
MKASSLAVGSSLLLLTMTIACGHADDSDGAAGADALSASKTAAIKSAAKDAFDTIQKLDDKKKFDKADLGKADKKGCYQMIGKMLPDDDKSPLKDVHTHAIGSDAHTLLTAISRLCNVDVITPQKLKSSCDTDGRDVELRSYDKSACDGDKVYVALLGDNKAAEDALDKHHHYDQLKDGELVIGGEDDSQDD